MNAVSNRAPSRLAVVLLAALGGCTIAAEDNPVDQEPEGVTSTGSITHWFQQGAHPSTSYAGATDTQLTQSRPTATAGAATSLRADGSDPNGTTDQDVVLLRWDLSIVPRGSTVRYASVTLALSDGSPESFELYAMRRAWSESAASWTQASSGVAWGQSGARGASDRGTTVLGTLAQSAPGAYTVVLNAAGIAQVQAWVDDPSTNFGFALADAAHGDGVAFASSESATVTSRPRLAVRYDPPASADAGADAADARDGASSDAVSASDAGADAADATSCHTAPWTDPTASARTACTFGPGASADTTLGDTATIAAARAAIQHVFIIMQENHSMDSYFGHTGHGIEGVPAGWTNPDSSGNAVAPHHFANPCPCDIGHSVTAMDAEYDNGRMDGFLRTDGTAAMGYFTDADHPFYTWMITTFATSDRYFSALLGPTGINRRYFYQGSTVSGATTLFDALNSHHIDWGDYVAGYQLSSDGLHLIGGNNLEDTYGHDYMLSHTHSIQTLFDALANDTALPPVVYVDVGPDEHPGDNGSIVNVHRGENAVRDVVTRLLASRAWAHSALIMTYDESGGFFDHVPPPPACVATSDPADAPFDRHGIRVPLFVVSPYARPGYVSHRLHSHTSVLRFIELLHGLPALTRRDANADALLDLFDFGCPSFAAAPTSIPAAGSPLEACSVCVR